MSATELSQHQTQPQTEFSKLDDQKSALSQTLASLNLNSESKSQQHPLHQYDLTKMSKFYESCVNKLSEQNPKWKPSEWVKTTPMPSHLSAEDQSRWSNPVVISEKQRVYESFAKLAKDLGEPMILMPNFDISDLQNFELFLDSLKTDGVNAIRKYKQYLSNKDMRKQEIDLVCVHARYGVLLVETKESDYVDYKRKSRAKMMVSQTKSLFKALGRLIAESKGLAINEASVPCMEFVALPNCAERPQEKQYKPKEETPKPPMSENGEQPKTESTTATTSRQLNYLVKSDLESPAEFMKWWSKAVVEPKLEQERLAEEQKKVNKFDWQLLNALVALVNCIKSNSILPVVYPESDLSLLEKKPEQAQPENGETKKESDESLQFQPALNIHAEFFKPKHEQARALTKCVVYSQDSERIRKTICLQTLWLLLNDSQKKISVVCSDLNKPYYEEFFARQRKIYNSLNNVRFYTDLHSCDHVSGLPHTLKKDGECWFFDSSIPNGSLSDVLERAKLLNSYWVFCDNRDLVHQHKDKVPEARLVDLDEDKVCNMNQLGEDRSSIKLPLRLQCDLLIIGDMISANQLKYLYKNLQAKSVPSQAAYYTQSSSSSSNSHHHHHNNSHHNQQLNFNPAKKFRSVKFIRGGTIDTIRNSLKMHDSIQAQVVVMHVGDEDLFKTRNSVPTVEKVKELATLVKEYCPKSFVVLSTLMRRMSRTENGITNEVNKGIVQFCKQTRDSLNCYYMMNSHFEPDYHTHGRLLNSKGLKQYVDNVLFVVDYFLVKNNKQH